MLKKTKKRNETKTTALLQLVNNLGDRKAVKRPFCHRVKQLCGSVGVFKNKIS